MASWRPKKCKGCGARKVDGYQISKRGWCWSCGLAATREAIEAMAYGEGSAYDRWLRAGGGAGRPPAGNGGVGSPVSPAQPLNIERASRIRA